MTDDARLRAACHECAHSVAAHLLDREVLLVSLNGPLGGPCSIDRLPYEPLQGRGRRPVPHWHRVADEVIVVLAGDIGEALADELDTPDVIVAGPGRRVPDRPPVPPGVPRPVVWQQPLQDEPEWPVLHFSDRDQAELLVRSITSSDEEHEALMHALTLRAQAFVTHRHFAFLWRALVDALLREPAGELLSSEAKHTLKRAEVSYTTTAIQEAASDGFEAA